MVRLRRSAGAGSTRCGAARPRRSPRNGWRSLEKTAMNLSFKMVTLEAMIEADKLTEGLPVAELARRSYAILRRSPDLFRDLEGVEGLEDPEAPDEARFLAYWRRKKNPIDAWISGRDGGPWFKVDDHDRFVPVMPIPSGDEETFTAMTRELVDYRLARVSRCRHEAGQRHRAPAAATDRLSLAARRSGRRLRSRRGRARAHDAGVPHPGARQGPLRGARDRRLDERLPAPDPGRRLGDPARHAGRDVHGFEGKVALCRVPDPGGGQSFQLKRVVRAGEGFVLRSDNLDARPRSYELANENESIWFREIRLVSRESVWFRENPFGFARAREK